MGTFRTNTLDDKLSELSSRDHWEANDRNFGRIKPAELRACVNYEYARQSRRFCNHVADLRRAETGLPSGHILSLSFEKFLAFHVPQFPRDTWSTLPERQRKLVGNLCRANRQLSETVEHLGTYVAFRDHYDWYGKLCERSIHVFELNLTDSPENLADQFKAWVIELRRRHGIRTTIERRGSKNNPKPWNKLLECLEVVRGRTIGERQQHRMKLRVAYALDKIIDRHIGWFGLPMVIPQCAIWPKTLSALDKVD
jgi:hypothetical protein